MCLAVPAKVKEIHDAVGKVDISGVTRDISLMLLPETQVATMCSSMPALPYRRSRKKKSPRRTHYSPR